MARKRYRPEEIVAKLRQVDVLVSQGQLPSALHRRECRALKGPGRPDAHLRSAGHGAGERIMPDITYCDDPHSAAKGWMC